MHVLESNASYWKNDWSRTWLKIDLRTKLNIPSAIRLRLSVSLPNSGSVQYTYLCWQNITYATHFNCRCLTMFLALMCRKAVNRSVYPSIDGRTHFRSCSSSPCGRGTVVSIVSCRCTYCCLETSHGNRHYLRYCAVAFCYVLKCELSYMCKKTTSAPSEIISNRVCEIWLGIGEGANV